MTPFYRWDDIDGVTCFSSSDGSISMGERDFSYGALPEDAQLIREDRFNGVPDFTFGPYDAPDGSGDEDFSPFGSSGMGPYPFVYEQEYETVIDGAPAYVSIAVVTCYQDGPARTLSWSTHFWKEASRLTTA